MSCPGLGHALENLAKAAIKNYAYLLLTQIREVVGAREAENAG